MFTSLFLKILNKEASSVKSKPDEIIASLDIREGDIIADIGSGGVLYALCRKSRECRRVYAVDEAEVSGIHTTQGGSGRVG
jgi:hypothetical protein